MNPSDRIELKLTALNVAVFTAVLLSFALCVYTVFVQKTTEDIKSDLRHLADAATASIDFDDDPSRAPDSAAPDLIGSALPDESAGLLNALKLEWYTHRRIRKLQKGTFEINVPFQADEGFQTQVSPHGLVFTKPVIVGTQLLGYVRVAQPLSKNDRAAYDLVLGLAAGIAAAVVLSAIGIAFLIRQSMSPIHEYIRRLRQFTSDASHELRNPVNAIRTNTEVALKYSDGMRTADKEKFELILDATTQMNRLVQDLLALTRAGKEGKEECEPVNVAQVVGRAVDSVSWLACNKSIQVRAVGPSDIAGMATELYLYGIVVNLIENAINYSSPGQSVEIEYLLDGDSIRVKVSDRGLGISSEDLPKIFDRFWRAEKARHFRSGGNGLGLSIASEFAKKIGADISVTSTLGQGSCFTVTLRAAGRLRGTEPSDVVNAH
jgi:two-component system, OmpR family, manganese sensing sensor histidine kinase